MLRVNKDAYNMKWLFFYVLKPHKMSDAFVCFICCICVTCVLSFVLWLL